VGVGGGHYSNVAGCELLKRQNHSISIVNTSRLITDCRITIADITLEL
jgi:hypothetical protein